MWCPMCNLIKTCTLLFDVALVTVALQHGLANRAAPGPGPPTPCGVLEACLQTAPALDRGGRRSQAWNKKKKKKKMATHVSKTVALTRHFPHLKNNATASRRVGTYGGLSDSLHSK